MNKYISSPDEDELLPNLLNLITREDIERSEFEGFLFPAAKYISQSMDIFENDILLKLPSRYYSDRSLIRDIAVVHGELLFIHPFREGNGRTARVLANLMTRKQGFKGLKFERINEKIFPEYVLAVQMVADRNYEPMEKIIELIF